jgi:hypothetical protein
MYKAQDESGQRGSSQKQESRTYLGTGRTRVGREARSSRPRCSSSCRADPSPLLFFSSPFHEQSPSQTEHATKQQTNKNHLLDRTTHKKWRWSNNRHEGKKHQNKIEIQSLHYLEALKAPKEIDVNIMSRNGALTNVLFALAYPVGMPDCITWTEREIYLISASHALA